MSSVHIGVRQNNENTLWSLSANNSNLLHESFPSAKCLSQDATADPPNQKSLPFEHQSPE